MANKALLFVAVAVLGFLTFFYSQRARGYEAELKKLYALYDQTIRACGECWLETDFSRYEEMILNETKENANPKTARGLE